MLSTLLLNWNRTTSSALFRWILVLLIWLMPYTQESWGQYRDPRGSKSYSDYYRQNLKITRRPVMNPGTYTFNRVYQNNPAISPYINLLRSPGLGGTNYQTYVKPEIKRREQQAARQQHSNTTYRPPAQTTNRTSPTQRSKYPTRSYKAPSRSSYYSHYYGSSRKGR